MKLRKSPIIESRVVTRLKYSPLRAVVKGVTDLVFDPRLTADSKVESLKSFLSPFRETETVEITERRVA
jgi:hypothetical protein